MRCIVGASHGEAVALQVLLGSGASGPGEQGAGRGRVGGPGGPGDTQGAMGTQGPEDDEGAEGGEGRGNLPRLVAQQSLQRKQNLQGCLVQRRG